MGIQEAQRIFIPGSRWLYYKVYAGKTTCENLLIDSLYPIVCDLIENKIIDKWFFVRYADPETHLRIRVSVTTNDGLLLAMNSFTDGLEAATQDGLIWKVQLDSYVRELERYGSNWIDSAEVAFFHDSTAVLEMLRLIKESGNEDFRWIYALRSIDRLLDDFGLMANDKLELLSKLRANFGQEFNMERPLKMQLDAKFRDKRQLIDRLFKEQDNEFVAIFNTRSQKLSEPISKYKALVAESRFQVTRGALLSSLIHMNMNRIFSDRSRLHELVCYDFLWRHTRSEYAQLSRSNESH